MRYNANKRANNKLLLAFVSIIARGLFFVKTTVADRQPKIYVLLKGCFSFCRRGGVVAAMSNSPEGNFDSQRHLVVSVFARLLVLWCAACFRKNKGR